MKNLGLLLIMLFTFSLAISQNLKPYVLGAETTVSVQETRKKVKASLEKNNLQVVGEYQPANDKTRWLIIFTSSELKNAVKKVGGLTGFASTLRVAITAENGKTLVSYTNPAYWGNAYFQDKFSQVQSSYSTINQRLQTAMKASGKYVGTEFGSKDGLSANDLHEYHYMMGMPYFEDTVELEDFDSYSQAIAMVESSIKKGQSNVKLVYKVSIPGKDLTLYGFALGGETGESQFLPIIDQGNPKHTAFLPYEILVMGDEVHMLHGRYRIALSFPDLTMGTFSKIMSTPGDIEDLLEKLVE